MSDFKEQQGGAPPVTNPNVHASLGGRQSTWRTGGPLPWEPPSIEEAAGLFPNHEILGLLGRGGMGAVYKARQVALDRMVAIKLLPLEVSVNKDFAERFVREARTMARLNHPNIIAVHDFGTTSEGHLFIVMEFIDGATLHAIVHEVGLVPDQALWVAGEVCAALRYAHGKGVVHRDIKPANVMVDSDNHVKVTDFGLARLTDVTPEMRAMTMTSVVMGTPDYMAPEQKRGMNVDHRADLFSLGVMLYEMVCRETPQGVFEPPSRRTDCDERFDAIVLKAMQQNPDRRYQSAQEMEADIERARASQESAPAAQAVAVATPAAHVPQAMAPVAMPRRPVAVVSATPMAAKNRTPLYVGIAAVVVVGIIGGIMALQNPKPEVVEKRPGPGDGLPQEPTAPTTPATPAPTAETPKAQPPGVTPKIEPAPVAVAPALTPSLPETRPTIIPPMPTPVPGAAPAPAPAAEQNATEKWLAEQVPQWQEAFVNEVSAPFEKAVADAKKGHLSALDAQLSTATRNAQLSTAVAFRDEIQRLNTGGGLGVDDANTPLVLKAMRAAHRNNLTQLLADRSARAKAVQQRYDAILAQNQLLLTQRLRFDEALLLKAKREELSTAWLRPLTLPDLSGIPAAPIAPPAPVLNVPPPVVPSPGPKFVTTRTSDAIKERPFENTLGMRFVPVPITGGPTAGQRVLFSVWETRRQDWEVMALEKRGKNAKPEPVHDPLHPKASITWDEAQSFCAWLTEHEQKAGRLGANERYRLPSDHEWSCAVGIGDKENPAQDPEGKSNKIPDVFPWGTAWPPSPGAGNYKGEETDNHNLANEQKPIKGYNDGFAYTAPAGSFPPNRFGIYDLGGNIAEWCEDLIHPNRDKVRLVRGSNFTAANRTSLLSSNRGERGQGARDWYVGVRVVIGVAR